MGKRTHLYDMHIAAGAQMVDFGGWDMPLNYGSQIEEHHQVRNDAGMFDVSHMTIVDLHGEQVRPFLSKLLANDIARLKSPGKALYSCMLNEEGYVLDDLIVYYMNDSWFRLVVNSATREKDLAWIAMQGMAFELQIKERDDLTMIAVQGPNARSKTQQALGERGKDLDDIGVFFIKEVDAELAVARTGYTGEDGYEIMLPVAQATTLWAALLEAEVRPCGLGARDTLRLEAGMNLYSTDMDETVTPLESGLGWTVAWEPQERNFIGRQALEKQRDNGVSYKLVGLVLQERGVLRNHQKVIAEGLASGEITSGSFSPTLGKAIAFARIKTSAGDKCKVEIRGRLLTADVVKPPFVRKGKACI
ncbi:Aminomethyltransferase (glycine cleavage system T protein) [hydrothermal vent metagenome]|uniref:aminomethyltransferase n=1 Tax=hydrothermal vent metagenome TaxID=652676 RepID=A0A3B1BAP8_9ZZZZ